MNVCRDQTVVSRQIYLKVMQQKVLKYSKPNVLNVTQLKMGVVINRDQIYMESLGDTVDQWMDSHILNLIQNQVCKIINNQPPCSTINQPMLQ